MLDLTAVRAAAWFTVDYGEALGRLPRSWIWREGFGKFFPEGTRLSFNRHYNAYRILRDEGVTGQRVSSAQRTSSRFAPAPR